MSIRNIFKKVARRCSQDNYVATVRVQDNASAESLIYHVPAAELYPYPYYNTFLPIF